MTPHRFVVLAQRVRGFDSLEEAAAWAQESIPAVVCERRPAAGGGTVLVEVLRHDLLPDPESGLWSVRVG